MRGFVESTGIAQTIAEVAELARVEPPDPSRSPSLLAAARAGRGAETFPLTAWPGHGRRAVRAGSFKLITTARGKDFYDLSTDPGERADRAGQEPERVTVLERQLKELDAAVVRPSRVATDPETLEMLREGGYLEDTPVAARRPQGGRP